MITSLASCTEKASEPSTAEDSRHLIFKVAISPTLKYYVGT
jgi:hypothetical protein